MTPEELEQLKQLAAQTGPAAEGAKLRLKQAQQSGQMAPTFTSEGTTATLPTEQTPEEENPFLAAATKDPRPMVANSPGMFFSDLGKIAANAGTGLATDYIDLALMGVDAVRATVGDMDWTEVGNDADNPWTQARRQAFQPESQAGQAVGNLVRVGLLFASLPKALAKGGILGSKLVRGASKIGGSSLLRNRLTGVAAAKAEKAIRKGRKVGSFDDAGKVFAQGSNPKKAADIIGKTPELADTLLDTAKRVNAKAYGGRVMESFRTMGISIAERYKPKNLASTLGYDALGSFMVAGEGDLLLDETVSDMLRDMGSPFYLPALTTNLDEDTAFSYKMKQVVEGIPLGIAIQPMLDLWTVARVARRLKASDKKSQDQIIRMFSERAEAVGQSVAKVYTGDYSPYRYAKQAGKAVPGQEYVPEVVDGSRSVAEGIPDPFDQSAIVPYGDRPQSTSELLADVQYDRNISDARRRQDALDENYGPPGEIVADPDGQLLDLNIDEANVRETGPRGMRPRLSPDNPRLEASIEPVDVRVEPPTPQSLPPAPRQRDATVTPQTIRAGFEEDMARAFYESMELSLEEVSPGVFAQSKASIKQLMPQTRIDAFDYLKNNPINFNGMGVVNAADSIWANAIVNRGLKEGWIKVDENFDYTLNRRVATDLDISDADATAAKKLDEAAELEQFDLDTPTETGVALPQQEALVDAKAAEIKGAEISEEDAARTVAKLAPAEQGDDELIQQMLGLSPEDIEDLTGAIIEKPPGTRRIVVSDYDGNELGRFTRKSEAEKFVQRRSKTIRDDLLGRARQASADAAEEPFEISAKASPKPVDQELKGTITLTPAQKKALANYSEELGAILNKDLTRKTFDFNYYSMKEFADGLQAMLDSGAVSGNQKRVLRNIVDKVRLEETRLDPIARARARIDDVLSTAERGITHGDFC